MVPLGELQRWLLTELRRPSSRASINHALVMALGETYHATNAVHLSGLLQEQDRVYHKTIEMICEKIEESCQYDIWAFDPLERVEGPYESVQGYDRMLQLKAETGRAHIRVIIGSEQEKLFQTAISSSSKNAELT